MKKHTPCLPSVACILVEETRSKKKKAMKEIQGGVMESDGRLLLTGFSGKAFLEMVLFKPRRQ